MSDLCRVRIAEGVVMDELQEREDLHCGGTKSKNKMEKQDEMKWSERLPQHLGDGHLRPSWATQGELFREIQNKTKRSCWGKRKRKVWQKCGRNVKLMSI